MTVSVERTPGAVFFRTVTRPDWRSVGSERLLELLSRPLPHNARFMIDTGTLLLTASLPAACDPAGERAAWLTALLEAAPIGSPDETPGSSGTDDLVEMVQWVAAGKGWVVRDGDGPGLRLAVPGEPDMPPLSVSPAPGGLLVERALPLLPARHAAPVVRAAFAHALCALNRMLLFARARVHDPTALTAGVESHLAPGADEDEVEHALEGVRHGARQATSVLECLRHRAVAEELAIALDLPEVREQVQEE